MTVKRNVKGVDYECLLFPMEYLSISQGVRGSLSHAGCCAIDICGRDNGIDDFYAPCAMKCVGYDPMYYNGHPVWFESVNKVLFADGTIDYATMLVLHDENIDNIIQEAGRTYRQGEAVLSEGAAGKATGNHSHVEIAKGKFRDFYAQNSMGTWHLPGGIEPDKAFVVDGRILLKGGQPTLCGEQMNWITSLSIKPKVPASPKTTGWKKTSSGKWQYYDKNGNLFYGWLKDGKYWYYLGRSSYALTGWNELQYKKKKQWFYFFPKNCRMATSWQQIDGKWYYFDEDGCMLSRSWIWTDGSYYYVGSNGAMVTGWQTIEGTKYYFKSNGAWDSRR